MTVNATSPFFERRFLFMKVVRKICCGMDVHKDIIVATIASTDGNNVTTYLQKQFSTFNYDLLNLLNWLKQNNCYDVCMESTGKYWIPIFNVLETELNVFLTHPKYVKAIKGKKTDKKDSKWIADIFKHDLLKFSFIRPKHIRELREISRYRIKLVGMRASEKNRYQNCLTVSNIGLGSVFSDPLGKSSRAVLEEVMHSDIITEENIKKLLLKSASKKSEQVMQAIQHSHIETDQRFKLEHAMKHLENLDKYIQDCEVEMIKRCAPFIDIVKHITQLPGISFVSAMIILSEIGIDMNQWASDKEVASWVGVTPQNNESANKKKSVRISKAGQYIKPILVQCALAAIKCNSEPYFKIKYNRIKKRRGNKKAIIAIARMLLVSIYHMVKTGENFNPSDYDSFKNPKQNQSKITTKQALEHLQSLGVDISQIQIPEIQQDS